MAALSTISGSRNRGLVVLPSQLVTRKTIAWLNVLMRFNKMPSTCGRGVMLLRRESQRLGVGELVERFWTSQNVLKNVSQGGRIRGLES